MVDATENCLYAAYKEWTAIGGTKFPLKHKAFAKRVRSRGVGGGGQPGKQAVLAEDSSARRRVLTVRHRHAPVSRRICRGHVRRCFRAVFRRIENLGTRTCADDHWWCVSEAKFHQAFGCDLFLATSSPGHIGFEVSKARIDK